MTRQEIFDKVVRHLRRQGCKALEGHRCKYRIKVKGRILKCAAGCLIRKSDYNPNFEGESWGSNDTTALAARIGEAGLVQMLQDIHDQHDTDEWELLWAKVAKLYKLEMP